MTNSVDPDQTAPIGAADDFSRRHISDAFFLVCVDALRPCQLTKAREIIFVIPCPFEEVGTLCMQLLIQFYANSFETLQMCWSWSEEVHVLWKYSSDYFCHFSQVELSHFQVLLQSN